MTFVVEHDIGGIARKHGVTERVMVANLADLARRAAARDADALNEFREITGWEVSRIEGGKVYCKAPKDTDDGDN